MSRRIALYARTEKPEIVTGVRIGITKAAELPWRYGLKGSKFLSKPFLTELPSFRAMRSIDPDAKGLVLTLPE